MVKNKINLSAVIIAKNEEDVIGECIESLESLADEIIVVDSGSQDKTEKIAKDLGAKVYKYKKGGFSDWRNEGLRRASGKWIFYIDADERVTPLLKKEIKSKVSGEKVSMSSYAIPRRNIILGKEMKHGGWWPDYVKRLFLKSKLREWRGDLHEEPVIDGELGHLEEALIHKKHDNLEDMVEKSNIWSEKEAKLLLDANHPKMTWWRFIRIMLTEFWYRMIKLRGFLDGGEGIVYALYQTWYRFLVYAKLWELQNKTQKSKVKAQS